MGTLVVWCAASLVIDIAECRLDAVSSLPHVASPRRWRLGHPYVEEVRELTRQAAGNIPAGEEVGLLASPRVGPGQRPVLRMWIGYLMPAQELRLMPRYRVHILRALKAEKPGTYLLAYRYRPVGIPGLETVFEHPLGGLYRVAPAAVEEGSR